MGYPIAYWILFMYTFLTSSWLLQILNLINQKISSLKDERTFFLWKMKLCILLIQRIIFRTYFFYFVKHEKDVCHNFDLNVDVCFVLNMFFNPSLFKRPLTRKKESKRKIRIKYFNTKNHAFFRYQINLYSFDWKNFGIQLSPLKFFNYFYLVEHWFR